MSHFKGDILGNSESVSSSDVQNLLGRFWWSFFFFNIHSSIIITSKSILCRQYLSLSLYKKKEKKMNHILQRIVTACHFDGWQKKKKILWNQEKRVTKATNRSALNSLCAVYVVPLIVCQNFVQRFQYLSDLAPKG